MYVITDEFSDPSGLSDAARRVRGVLSCVSDNSVDLVLVILPRVTYTRIEMDDLLRHIRTLKEDDDTHQGELAFALAAFHPDAPPDTSDAERFIPFLRRTPDPMVQAVRRSTLADIEPTGGAGTAYFDLENANFMRLEAPPRKPLRRRIAEANLATCQRHGIEVLSAKFDSILKDHARTHERLRGRNR